MEYSGVTGNERLWHSGLIDEFDLAIKNRDAKRVAEILGSVELDDESIKANLERAGLEMPESDAT
jgi:hypothetical protein